MIEMLDAAPSLVVIFALLRAAAVDIDHMRRDLEPHPLDGK